MSTMKVSGKKIEVPSPDSSVRFEIRPGGWLIAHLANGERIRLAFSQVKNQLSFNIAGRSFHTQILENTNTALGHSGSDADLVAQFPGKVRKVLVQPDTQVKAGEVLLLIEAMKMEFQIKAPTDGKVKKVLVQEAQQLTPGDRLVDFEAAGKNG